MSFIDKIKDRLIDDWRNASKFWTVRIAAIWLAIITLVSVAPDTTYQLWVALPDSVKAYLPDSLVRFLNGVVPALIIAARLFKQWWDIPETDETEDKADG